MEAVVLDRMTPNPSIKRTRPGQTGSSLSCSSDWPAVHTLNEAAFETSALVRAALELQTYYLRDAHGKIEFPAAFNNV